MNVPLNTLARNSVHQQCELLLLNKFASRKQVPGIEVKENKKIKGTEAENPPSQAVEGK